MLPSSRCVIHLAPCVCEVGDHDSPSQETGARGEDRVHSRTDVRPWAIVIGLDCLQGLQSARVLADRGVSVLGVVKDPTHHAVRTRACKRILRADTGGEPLIELLERLGPTFASKPVLFPCQDKNVLVISRERDRLAPWYHVMLADQKVVELMMDKAAFYAYAMQADLPLPPTVILHDRDDAERAATELPYPAVLKPSIRLRRWSAHTKVKAVVARTPQELLAHYDRFSQWADVLIAQQLIEGSDRNHVTCNCYFDGDGDAAVTFTTRKLRQWPPRTGQACLAEEVRDDAVTELTVALFAGLRYRGLGYLETKREESTGRYLIIEPNIGRPTGRSAAAEAAGVELLYTMYCDAVGRPLPSNRQQTYQGVKWIHLLRDLQASLHHWQRGELTVREWWESIRGRRAYAVWSWRDPRPFLVALRGAVRAILAGTERGTDD